MVLILRKDVARVAREYVGTTVRHHGRQKGIAIDCIGLVWGIAAELGHHDTLPRNYTTLPNPEMVMREVDAKLVKQDRKDARVGDIAVLWGSRLNAAQHFGVIAEEGGRLTIIHAMLKYARVVEHGYERQWVKRTLGLYAIPGTEPA